LHAGSAHLPAEQLRVLIADRGGDARLVSIERLAREIDRSLRLDAEGERGQLDLHRPQVGRRSFVEYPPVVGHLRGGRPHLARAAARYCPARTRPSVLARSSSGVLPRCALGARSQERAFSPSPPTSVSRLRNTRTSSSAWRPSADRGSMPRAREMVRDAVAALVPSTFASSAWESARMAATRRTALASTASERDWSAGRMFRLPFNSNISPLSCSCKC